MISNYPKLYRASRYIALALLISLSFASDSETNQLIKNKLFIPDGIDDLTLWQTEEPRPILVSTNFQNGRLYFFSPSEQGYLGKVNGRYFSEPELKKEILQRKEDSIYFPYGQNSFSPDYTEDSFGAIWSAVIRPSYNEKYKFTTRTDDGVKLWVDGNLVIDHWRDMGATDYSAEIVLQAGKDYNLKMEYYDRGGDAYADLSWESPSTPKTIIREIGSFDYGYTTISPYGLDNDWDVNYYKGREFKELLLSRKEASLNFITNTEPFAKGIPNDNFCARFKSNLKIPKTGPYTFYTTSDDGIRLTINGKLLIDQWTWMGPTEFSEIVNLTEGETVSIEVDYFQGGGGKYLKLEWKPPNANRSILSKKGNKFRNLADQQVDLYPGKIYSFDLNSDKKNDLIIVHPTYNGKVSILTQDNSGFLNPPLVLKVGRDPKQILFFDLNSDLAIDMIITGKSLTSFTNLIQKNNEWKLESAPKWTEVIQNVVILQPKGKNTIGESGYLGILGKNGNYAKVKRSESKGWGNYEEVSPEEKKEIQSKAEKINVESKCVSLSGKRQVCYEKENRQLISFE